MIARSDAMWHAPATLLAVLGAVVVLGAVLAVWGVAAKRRRRAMSGLLALLVLVPALIAANGGVWPRGRSYLFVVPGNRSPETTAALARLIEAVPPRSAVNFVQLGTGNGQPPPTPAPGLWPDAAECRTNGVEKTLQKAPTLPVDRGWLLSLAKFAAPPWRTRLSHLWPQATVVLPYGDDFWRAVPADSLDEGKTIEGFGAAETQLLTVDTLPTAATSGRLELVLSSPGIPALERVPPPPGSPASSAPTRQAFLQGTEVGATLRLVGSRLKAIPDPNHPVAPYRVHAWIDRPLGDGQAAAALDPNYQDRQIRSHANSSGRVSPKFVDADDPPESPRETAFLLQRFVKGGNPTAKVLLEPGLHRLDVELEFLTDLGSGAVPVKYSASATFEVYTSKLLVVKPSPPDDPAAGAAAPTVDWEKPDLTWVHHPSTQAGRLETPFNLMLQGVVEDKWSTPPPVPLSETPRPRLAVGWDRLPFSEVQIYAARALQKDPAKAGEFRDELKDAAMVLVQEPDGDTTRWLDQSGGLGDYARRGGLVLTVKPPCFQAPAEAPAWMPAQAEATEANPPEPLDEYSEARVYFVPDTSRTSAVILARGQDQQCQTINDLYDKLEVVDRNRDRITRPLQSVSSSANHFPMSVTEQGSQIGFADAGVIRSGDARQALVVPPLLPHFNESGEQIAKRYGSSSGQYYYGVLYDLAPSWVISRLWTVVEKDRLIFWNSPKPAGLPAEKTEKIERVSEDLGPKHDIGIRLPHRHPRTVVVVFALDTNQPMEPAPLNVWQGTGEFQVRARITEEYTINLPSGPRVTPKELKDAGVHLIIVPIKSIYPADWLDVTIPGGGTKKFIGQSASLRDAAAQWGADFIDLPLDTTAYGRTEDLVKPTVEAIYNKIREVIDARVSLNAGPQRGRALDLRVAASVDAPRSWRRLEPAGVPPAAWIDNRDGKKWPALVWKPLEEGAVFALAYSPLAYDRWIADGGPDIASIRPPDAPTPDGWGVQRLCDPVALSSRAIRHGFSIDNVRFALDGTCAVLDCTVPKGNFHAAKPPLLIDDKGNEAGIVSVAAVDVGRSRFSLSISADRKKPVNGWCRLVDAEKWSSAWSTRGIFLTLRPVEQARRTVVDSLRYIAPATHGADVALAEIQTAPPAVFDARWVAASLLPFLIILLLSPLARAYSPWRRRDRLDVASRLEADEDTLDIIAAFNATGLSVGSPVTQRPTGRVLQLRPMRPGDSPTAARRSDWAFFVDDIVASMGSSPMPRVIETPRLESLSILTLLDLHQGATTHDAGFYSDRASAMARVAALNALIATRRGGTHQAMALQDGVERGDTEAVGPEDTRPLLARLATGSSRHRTATLPELLPGEAVCLVTDPLSDVEGIIEQMARRAIEERCLPVVVFLIHPMQRREFGLMRAPGTLALLDRGDLNANGIDRYLNRRIESLTALLHVADGRSAVVRTDQPAPEMVTILLEEVWDQA